MITNEELNIKLDLILKNQEQLKALHLIELKALDFLVQHEQGPEDFFTNLVANILVDDIEFNKRGQFFV